MKKNEEVKINYHSGIYTLESEQYLPIALKEAWAFFSKPSNLSSITPPEMGFEITSGSTGNMYEGQIITYKVGIFPWIKTNWVTEITSIKENTYFIDEQRFGPYKMWHHEHHFKELGGAVHMFDKISYKIPFGLLGRMVHQLFIKNKLKSIFTYRSLITSRYFMPLN